MVLLGLQDAIIQGDLGDGLLSDAVHIRNGIKQGCPISPILFILAMEPLLLAADSSTTIRGLEFYGRRTLSSAYADDITLAVKDTELLLAFLTLAERFHKASGLAINLHKSWILPLGPPRQVPTHVGGIPVVTQGEQRRLLGLLRGHDTALCNKNIWHARINSFRASLIFSWNTAQLSYRERALVHTIFGVSVLIFAASAAPLPTTSSTSLADVGRRFLWRQTVALVKGRCCIGMSHGGLSWRDPTLVARSLRAQWIPKAIALGTDFSTTGFHHAISTAILTDLFITNHKAPFVTTNGPLGTPFDLLPLLDYDDFDGDPEHTHPFSTRCLSDWCSARGLTSMRLRNAPVKITCSLHGVGPSATNDFLHAHGRDVTAPCSLHIDLDQQVPANGISTIEGRWAHSPGHTLHHPPGKDNHLIPFDKVTAKALYWRFAETAFEPASCLKRWNDFGILQWPHTRNLIDCEDFWKSMTPPLLPASVFNVNFEVAHRVTPRRPQHQPWPICRRCGNSAETTEHVFYYCPAVAGTIWPVLAPTLSRLQFDPQTADGGTYILSLGLSAAEGPATILAFTRHLIHTYHLETSPTPQHLWPTLALSDLEASLKNHIERLFFRASRSSTLRSDLRLQALFEATWSRTSSQEGLLTLDWTTHTIRWHWGLT